MPVTLVKSKWVAGNLVFSGTGQLNLGVKTTQKRTILTAVDTAALSVAQVLAGHIDGTPTAAATYTTPAAADLIAAIPGAVVGTSFYFSINNKSAGANAITLAGGTDVAVDGTLSVAQNICRLFLLTVTSATAVSIYGMGT